jgi:hypothetical protein
LVVVGITAAIVIVMIVRRPGAGPDKPQPEPAPATRPTDPAPPADPIPPPTTLPDPDRLPEGADAWLTPPRGDGVVLATAVNTHGWYSEARDKGDRRAMRVWEDRGMAVVSLGRLAVKVQYREGDHAAVTVVGNDRYEGRTWFVLASELK